MFKELKRFISSMDLAIILIAAISGLSISSTFFDTPEVFSSTPFRILVGFFFLNLLTCSIKLWPNVLRVITISKKAKMASIFWQQRISFRFWHHIFYILAC